ncbi:MAG: 16S rRNA (guanine(527)-N(7))-methyltransferase RsmG [Clostridia bacterium]|nr:16S rRNA (guanine(527)-N(7))-methyltransferase RsmG [Clostridia bacterium]
MTEIIEKQRNLIGGEYKERFDAYAALLREYNEKYNLTTILEEKDVFYKHFLDSAIGEPFFTQNASVLEVGSGAGFPSIPLKLLRPDLSFTLLESVGKKCEFLRVVVDKLGLNKVNIYQMRAEEAAREETFREKFDFATARAVARMNTLSEYCLPFVKVGGKFIAYKSGEESEINEAKSAYKTLGGRLLKVLRYELPEGYGGRTLAIVEKVEKTPNKYPRGQGKERKSPL